MKSSLEKLSPGERNALVHWYDTESYKAFKRLCQFEIEGLGKDALGAQSFEQVKLISGQASMAAKLPKIIRAMFQESEDNKKKSWY